MPEAVNGANRSEFAKKAIITTGVALIGIGLLLNALSGESTTPKELLPSQEPPGVGDFHDREGLPATSSSQISESDDIYIPYGVVYIKPQGEKVICAPMLPGDMPEDVLYRLGESRIEQEASLHYYREKTGREWWLSALDDPEYSGEGESDGMHTGEFLCRVYGLLNYQLTQIAE